MERDVFGRLLAIGIENKIDIETCLSFPLAPIPPALSQYNGDMHQTPKSKLALSLKSMTEFSSLINEDVYLIDCFHFLRTIGTIPQSYGKISEYIFKKICSTTAKEIHFVGNVYRSPSIKDCEQEINTPYQITGESQNRDNNFGKSLSNANFKKALMKFSSEHWIYLFQ